MVANAEGEASRFSQVFAEYRRAPEVTRERMYLDTMQQVMSNTSKVMVDAKGNGAVVTTADVYQSNGVIHVVDKVLLPG